MAIDGVSIDYIIFDEWGGIECLLTENELNELHADREAQEFYEQTERE